MSDRIPILLDTDPGTDIDDALAISYLLAKPECELVGITTVTGDTKKRSAIAEVLCNAVGRADIPIVAGHAGPMGHGPGQTWLAQYDKIAHLPHRLDREPNSAVKFLQETIRSRPGEITLLTIGPMTNIGLLFAMDPEIPALLKNYVAMAGAFYVNNGWETNCVVDPISTKIVSHSKRESLKWVPLDVTTKCVMQKPDVEMLFQGPLLSLVAQMAEAWFESVDHITFHDPLAAVSLFLPEVIEYTSGTVHVDPDKGLTSFEPGEGPDEVALKVQPEVLFDEFFDTLSRV